MASNSFGTLFRFTTWGESHGKAVGVVVDGCPAGLPVNEEVIQRELDLRAPGRSVHTSPRKEKDTASICSGVFEGVSTGAPISIVVENNNADSSKYAALADKLRPGHANFTYLQKYGVFDHRGGGRASARETVGRVAAGAIAAQLLAAYGIQVGAFLSGVGKATCAHDNLEASAAFAAQSALFAPNHDAEQVFAKEIERVAAEGDSVGGVVTFAACGVPPGLGDPVYGKLSAMLASALFSIPACRGVEIGEGFSAAASCGSVSNDTFAFADGKIEPASNRAGGLLGGISTGQPVYGRVAFKPTSSIFQAQRSLDLAGRDVDFILPEGSRHDPCVALRAVPVVRAMCNVVLADALLMQRAIAPQGYDAGFLPQKGV